MTMSPGARCGTIVSNVASTEAAGTISQIARGVESLLTRSGWRLSSQALRPFCVFRYSSRLCYLSAEYLLVSTVHLLAAFVRLSRGFYRQHRFRLSWLHRRSALNWA